MALAGNMSGHRKISVFVSSTSEDLQSYRAVARLAILDMGWTPIMMEHFGAMTNPTVEACRQQLAQADVVLLLAAFRRGWVPGVEQGGDGIKSVTALELEFAKQSEIPILAMLARDSWPGNLWERDQQARDWVDSFRNGINRPAAFFDSESEIVGAREAEKMPVFRATVGKVLADYRESLPSESAAADTEYFESVQAGVVDGSSIPFLGPGVYGDGPLGVATLARALKAEGCGDQSCLATAAEYRERLLKSRERFLKELAGELNRQAGLVPAPPAVYKMLLKAQAPQLIVSSTCDLLLEQYLAANNKSYTIVCHVLRSRDHAYDGKILVLRDGKATFHLASKVDCKGADYTIYKPLGSPLLHAQLDPDLEIDTVVSTETDHLTLLRFLEHEDTTVPSVFSRPLQRGPILFLGYALDVWQYRLVMQVFHSIGPRGDRFESFALREPVSPIEKVAWQSLGTTLVGPDPSAFAQRVCDGLAGEQGQSSHA